MGTKVVLDEKQICQEYLTTNIGVETLALKHHVGKKRIKDILLNNGIEIKKRGKQPLHEELVVDWREQKYKHIDGYHYIISDPNSNFVSTDINNKSGILTTYIECTYGIDTPTLYDRRKYYMRTGNYWWEQWLVVHTEKDKPVKKCPYCSWETEDIDNKSGAFVVHLRNEHNKTVEEYLNDFPDDMEYFKKYVKTVRREQKLLKEGKYVTCPICGLRCEKLTVAHIKGIHGIEWEDFRRKYPDIKLVSDEMYEQTKFAQSKANMTIGKNRFISSYEHEIRDMLDSYGVAYSASRQLLIGKEIDILVNEKKIGIEFDGLKFHTEFFGKKEHDYHINKTIKCNEKGYGLIHIFEDEYVNHKDIVVSKIKHVLGLNTDLPLIGARKCLVREIYMHEAKTFLNTNHIQGYAPSTVYLGAFYGDKLVAVMSFKNGTIKNKGWDLTRFATDIKLRCPGIGSKLFRYFVKNYNPYTVFSFADRRWTLSTENNVYTKMGFHVDRITKPDYRYYNENVNRYKRVHKMTMNKKTLSRKYGFPLTMTELEMARKLGYDRIWDCGLIKYVYINPFFKN